MITIGNLCIKKLCGCSRDDFHSFCYVRARSRGCFMGPGNVHKTRLKAIWRQCFCNWDNYPPPPTPQLLFTPHSPNSSHTCFNTLMVLYFATNGSYINVCIRDLMCYIFNNANTRLMFNTEKLIGINWTLILEFIYRGNFQSK